MLNIKFDIVVFYKKHRKDGRKKNKKQNQFSCIEEVKRTKHTKCLLCEKEINIKLRLLIL